VKDEVSQSSNCARDLHDESVVFLKNDTSIDSASVSDIDVDSRRKRLAARGGTSLNDLVLIRRQNGVPSIFDGTSQT
jgi:hypothetical protein